MISYKRKIISIFVLLLIIVSVIPTTVSINPDNAQSYTQLKIQNITEGKGLTVSIKNEGDTNVRDIVLSVQSEGGFLFIPKKNYKISSLSPGDSSDIFVKIYGIGLGILTDCPKINIKLDSQNSNTIEEIVDSRVIGSYVKVLGKTYNNENSYEGYTLFTPEYSSKTYLINNDGEIVHTWKSNHIQGFAVYLQENGDLFRSDMPHINSIFISGGVSGCVEKFDWNGNIIWYFEYSNNQHCLHHDIEVLPNGNVLMIAWEYKTIAEAIKAGRNPKLLPQGRLWPDHIIEVEPNGSNGGDIVWEWHVWDHLVQDYDASKPNYVTVVDHPELLDLNFTGNRGPAQGRADWNHINSIDYNAELDQIVLSVHTFSEIWIIDHSTTTAEAASHSGGLLYRWGNPQAYQAGNADDQQLFAQHDAHWIENGLPGAGHILIFNNGDQRIRPYSSVDEIIPPVNTEGNYEFDAARIYGPAAPVWSYSASGFFSANISGAQRLPNGNTLICSGANGIIFEVTPNKRVVWEYVNALSQPRKEIFRAYRYDSFEEDS